MRKVKILEDTSYANIIQSVRELEDYFSSHAENSKLTFDWETTGLEYNATPLLMSLHFHQDGHPCILPINYYFSDGLPMNEVADVCNRYFPKFRLVAHNAKYDSMISKVYGIKDKALKIYADTLIMVHLYNPDLNKKFETRVKEDFGFEKKTFEEFISVGLKRKRKWSNINWDVEANDLEDTLASYSAEDAWFETKVYNKYKSELDEALWRIHDRIEIPLIDILRDAKIRGVLIDKALIEDMDVRAKVEEARLLNEVYNECGEVFNLNSSKQKQEIFFGKLKYPKIYETKSGAASTDSATFKTWAEMGLEIGITLNEYSKVHKLITGYLDTIPLMLDEHNVLRGDLNSCGTKTGRMSSSDPNLQNQPNNPKFPVRKAFIPRPGYVLVNYDYSQLELRVMAHLSKDPKFIHIFKTGGDPHGDVSKRLGIPRKSAKIMNFGVLYGMGPNHFADTFNVSIEEATKMVEDYHKTYAGFAKWKEQTENFAKRYGYVRNMFGRRRWLPEATKDPFHRNNKAYYGALREAVNTIVQGSGADLMKLATIATVKKIKEEGVDAHFLLQVHDENLFEAKYGADAIRCEQIMVECMEHTTELCIPLIADGKIIANWSEMHDENIPSLPFRFDSSLYLGLI